jgi:orc1/cdc6 family replication initiation protein
MTSNDLIRNPAPLKSDYQPSQFPERDREKTALTEFFTDPTETHLRNLHVHGPWGSGKTHLLRHVLDELPERVNVCYVSCARNDTQYKALQQLCSKITEETVGDGYHTSELQRRIEKRTGQVPTVIVLDEIDFLLLNDGSDLLYYLSRLEGNTGIVAVSSNQTELQSELEERTYSSLQPQNMVFKPYNGEQVYRILAERARSALKPQSLHRDALTYISSRTRNVSVGLRWLRTAAERVENSITVETVEETQPVARRRYVDSQLNEFTPHHELLFQALVELTAESGDNTTIQTGTVYGRYEDLCDTYGEDELSSRRIGDFLKQFELLDLVDADYHYGGQKGKTRELEVKEFYDQLTDLT